MWKRQALEAGRKVADMRCELEELREIRDAEPPAGDCSDDAEEDC